MHAFKILYFRDNLGLQLCMFTVMIVSSSQHTNYFIWISMEYMGVLTLESATGNCDLMFIEKLIYSTSQLL